MNDLGKLGVIAAAMTIGMNWEYHPLPRLGPCRKKTDTGYSVKGVEYGKPWRAPKKTGRNDPCECGSNLKHKNCRLKGLCKGEL